MPQAVGGNVEGAIRKVLSHSHIAAIAIAVLLLRSLDLGFRAFGRPLLLVVDFLFDLLALRGIPYGKFTLGQWLTLIPTRLPLGSLACGAMGVCGKSVPQLEQFPKGSSWEGRCLSG